MTSGLCCSAPACRPHPASLPVRVPTVEGLPSASFSFTSRLRLAVWLRLPSSAPIGSFHPIRFCPCWAHAGGRQDCLPHKVWWYLEISMSFSGLRVLSLESRRAVEIAELIRKQGGEPFVAPS